MVTEGITITSSNGVLNGSGSGNIVVLMINNKGRELQAGTYTWQSEENEKPFDLWAGYVTTDSEKATEKNFDLLSGTLTITKVGTTYKATFEGIAIQEDDNEEHIAGTETTVSFQFEGAVLTGDLD